LQAEPFAQQRYPPPRWAMHRAAVQASLMIEYSDAARCIVEGQGGKQLYGRLRRFGQD
jgi:hypothetical protein